MITRRDFTLGAASVAFATACPLSGNATDSQLTDRRPIGDTGDTLPIIGLGNSQSFVADDLADARGLIDIFVRHGGGYIDLAGVARSNVGKIAREKEAEESIFFGNYLDAGTIDETRATAGRLAKLQGKSGIDLANSRDLKNYRSDFEKYHALKAEGLTRYIGIARYGSNVIDSMIGLIKDKLVDFVQVNYSMIEPEAADRLLPLARDNGVAIVINRPFINGSYFDVVRGTPLPEWAAEFDCSSWAQFSLKFILANPAVNCVLTETTNPKHAVDNLGAGRGRLPDTATQKRMLELVRGML